MAAANVVRYGVINGNKNELAYDLHYVAQHNATHLGSNDQYPRENQQEDRQIWDPFSGVDAHEHYRQETFDTSDTAYTYPDPAMLTPASPRSDALVEGRRQLRSRRTPKRTDSPLSSTRGSNSRVSKSPRPKKTKAGKSDKNKGPRIPGPLSELTKELDVPVKDIEAWVNRPAEVRMEESTKRKGHIARPMNSFMLYRSAYADRTKAWCKQNNHQVVSSVAGESWPLEPEELREAFNEWAKVERANHAKAFPNYKFSPSKTNSRKRREDEDDDEEEFTYNDPDGEYVPSRRMAKHPKAGTEDLMHQVGNPYMTDPFAYAPRQTSRQPEWVYHEPARPLPSSYGSMNPYGGQYYQQVVGSNGYDSHYERNVHTPGSVYGSAPPVGLPVGLPGNQQYGYPQSRNQTPVPLQQNQAEYSYYDSNGSQHVDYAAPQYGFNVPSNDVSHFDDAYAAYPGTHDVSFNDPNWANLALDPNLMGTDASDGLWAGGETETG